MNEHIVRSYEEELNQLAAEVVRMHVRYDHGRKPGDSLAPEKRHHDSAAGIDPFDSGDRHRSPASAHRGCGWPPHHPARP